MQQSVSQGLCHMTNILILASIYRPWKDYSALFKRPESVFIQSGLQLLPMAFSTRRVCIDHFHWRLSCFPPLFLSLSFQKSQKQSYNSSPKSGSDTLEEKRNEKKRMRDSQFQKILIEKLCTTSSISLASSISNF